MAIPAILILAIITLILPKEIAGKYAVTTMLSSLLIGFLLSLKIAFSYERELRKVFLYLAPFILLLFLGNIKEFWEFLYECCGKLPVISLVIAGIAYVFLLMSCINIIKMTDLTILEKKDWFIVISMFILGNYIILFFLLNYKIEFTMEVMTKILFRIIDIAVVFLLLLVIIIYRKQSKEKNKESITFTVILIGIIISTIGDYVFEIITNISHQTLSTQFHSGTLLDSLYIFSYMLMAVGLFAHLNYHKWSIQKIDMSKVSFKFD